MDRKIMTMIKQHDVRWLQRFDNFRNALFKLGQAVSVMSEEAEYGEEIDELMAEGLIQRFEYTHELAWKLLKDYAEYQGYTDIRGSRDALRKAFSMGLIDDKNWMDSIEDRNLTSHNYDDETAAGIYERVVSVYYPLFKKLEAKMLAISGNEPKLFDE